MATSGARGGRPKKQASPVVMVLAAVVLIVVLAVLWKFTLGRPAGGPAITGPTQELREQERKALESIQEQRARMAAERRKRFEAVQRGEATPEQFAAPGRGGARGGAARGPRTGR